MTGFFGKIPSHGDFVTRELARDFIDGWDGWLQACIADSKNQLAERWLDIYLTSPIWRFGLAPGICGAGAWGGILMPSVDRVGRYFPLTIAASLPQDALPFQLPGSAGAWFEAMEAIALRSLDDDRFEANALQEAIAAVGEIPITPTPLEAVQPAGGKWFVALRGSAPDEAAAAVAHGLIHGQVPRYSVWWTPGTEDNASAVVVAADLPEPGRFIDMLHGGSRPAAAAPPARATAGEAAQGAATP